MTTLSPGGSWHGFAPRALSPGGRLPLMSCSASESSPCSGVEPHFPQHTPGARRPAPQLGPGIRLPCSRSLSRPTAPAVPQHSLVSSSRQRVRRGLSPRWVTGEKLRRSKGGCLTREGTAGAGAHTQAVGLRAQQLARAALVGPSPGSTAPGGPPLCQAEAQGDTGSEGGLQEWLQPKSSPSRPPKAPLPDSEPALSQWGPGPCLGDRKSVV